MMIASMQVIENWQNKELYCMFCGTNKSVKYMLTLDVNGREGTVCGCNKCVLIAHKPIKVKG